MKNCIQVWKSRKLSYKGKTIIVKNLLLSYCGFEIEMKGIPDKFKKLILDPDAFSYFESISKDFSTERSSLLKWIKENVKTLGVHHGYNVDNDKIRKDIIDRMKNCIQV
jgi:hypothetical protein